MSEIQSSLGKLPDPLKSGAEEEERAGGIRLCLILPDGKRQDIWQQSGSLSIGRGSNCSIQVQDVKISRRHAEIVLLEGSWTVLDCGSTNGTFINNQPVQQTAKLQQGDVVRVGLTRILVTMLPQPAEEKPLVQWRDPYADTEQLQVNNSQRKRAAQKNTRRTEVYSRDELLPPDLQKFIREKISKKSA